MRKKVVAGNWKMNKNLQEGIELAKEVNSKVKAAGTKEVTVIIGTPFIHLSEVNKIVDPTVVAVAAQLKPPEHTPVKSQPPWSLQPEANTLFWDTRKEEAITEKPMKFWSKRYSAP